MGLILRIRLNQTSPVSKLFDIGFHSKKAHRLRFYGKGCNEELNLSTGCNRVCETSLFARFYGYLFRKNEHW